MNCSEEPAESPFAAGAGVAAAPPTAEGDPYRALADLMVAVEALCPVWPPRDVFRDGGRMLL